MWFLGRRDRSVASRPHASIIVKKTYMHANFQNNRGGGFREYTIIGQMMHDTLFVALPHLEFVRTRDVIDSPCRDAQAQRVREYYGARWKNYKFHRAAHSTPAISNEESSIAPKPIGDIT